MLMCRYFVIFVK